LEAGPALRKSGAQLVAAGRIAINDIIAKLDELEPPRLRQGGGHLPGLIRGVARTAVVAGTATAVSNRVSRRQANRWAGQEQAQAYEQQAAAAAYQPAAAPAAGGTGQEDKLAQLKELGEPKASGILTEAGFEAEKAKILAG
jgi:hypothetical protein